MKNRYTVGYLITADKASKHLTESFRQRAREACIDIVTLDGEAPLDQQANLHAIIHKAVGNSALEQRLAEFHGDHPEVPIIDAVDKVRLLRDRANMLDVLSGGGFVIAAPHDAAIKSHLVGRPPQVVVLPGTTFGEVLDLLDSVGLRLPLVAKLQHSGQPGSHKVGVVNDLGCLQAVVTSTSHSTLQPPVVLQQFVAHGPSITKVYVAGAAVVAVQRPTFEADRDSDSGFVTFDPVSHFRRARPAHFARSGSLPPVERDAIVSPSAGGFARIEVAADHAARATADGASLAGSLLQHPCGESQQFCGTSTSASKGAHHHQSANLEAPESSRNEANTQLLPPEWLLRGLAATLRHNTGLQLFNFDLLTPTITTSFDSRTPDYFVIDINFFPGFEKLPNYERLMVSFLRGVVTNSTTDGGYGDTSFLACCQMGPGC